MTWTRAQWTILLVAWLGWVFDIMDAALFNFAKVPMFTSMLGETRYKEIGAVVEGNIQAIFLLGWAIGGLIFGVLADRYGRTRVLIATILMYSLFTGLTALCRTPEQVAVARFLTALGIGGEWAAGAALVAEAFRQGGRAPASAFLQSAAAFGPIFAALANRALAGKPWQWLFLVGIFPALISVVIRLYVKEPRPVERERRFPLAELWSDPIWRKRALVAMVVGTVGVAGAGTATYWLPNLVKAASEGLPKEVYDVRLSNLTMLSHIGTLAGVILVPLICDAIGRRTTIAFFYLLTPIVVLMAIGGGADYSRLVLLMPLVFFFSIGVSAAFVLYFPELFPTRMRATGAGLAYNVGRVLSIGMPLFTGYVTGALKGNIASAVVMSGSIYIIGLLALPFAPETKGRPLED